MQARMVDEWVTWPAWTVIHFDGIFNNISHLSQ
jgi:hypothetical protein